MFGGSLLMKIALAIILKTNWIDRGFYRKALIQKTYWRIHPHLGLEREKGFLERKLNFIKVNLIVNKSKQLPLRARNNFRESIIKFSQA